MRRSVHILFSSILSATLFLIAIPARGQELTRSAVEKRLAMIRNGQADEVKAELPSLLTKYQNDPGVLYLQGLLTNDGSDAVKIFQSVVDNFPKSEWTDDALYRIYQYYYALGLYKTADQKYGQLRQRYPNSPHIARETRGGVSQQTEEAETPELPRESGGGTFAVQVGAFSSVENANKQKKFFHNIGYSIEVLNKVKRGKSFYLVWIGNFKSYDDARKFSNGVKGKYKIEPIVVQR